MKALVDHLAFNVAVLSLLLILPWQFGQIWLYAGSAQMSHLQGIRICVAVTAADATIMLLAFVSVAVAAHSQARVRAPIAHQAQARPAGR